jgi:hypothetical protein
MAKNHPISDSAIRLQLTAYLDGELDDAEIREVEQRLIDDPTFRARMQELQKSWDMLDLLPTSPAANSFTKSTMELVIGQATKNPTQNGQRRFWMWPLRFGALLALVLALFAGSYGLTRYIQNSPNRFLYNNLPLIENLNQLQNADSLAFLGMLLDEGLFSENDESGALDAGIGGTDGSLPPKPDQAEKYIRALPTDQLALLRSNRNSFEGFSSQQQMRLRDLYDQIQTDPRRDELLTVLRRYSRWLETLNETSRATLLDMPPDQRIVQIPELKQQQMIQSFGKAGATRMPEQDAQAVYQWVVAMLERQAERIQWKFLRLLERHEINQSELPLLMPENSKSAGTNSNKESTRKRDADLDVMHFGQMLLAIGKSKPDELSFIITSGSVRSEIEILKSVVSQKAVSIIESQPAEEQIQLAFSWVQVALMSVFRAPEQRLQEYFDQLSDEEKAALDQLPPDQRKLQLKKQYLDWSKTRRNRISE